MYVCTLYHQQYLCAYNDTIAKYKLLMSSAKMSIYVYYIAVLHLPCINKLQTVLIVMANERFLI